ncbi:hypothetical protein PRVXT_002632 [Proteinivorax tanatarense]|uniref:Uncharacterized protein n=1 Tax=Proteinivorax tanatarense TaxID=1260629 RepID=A0AAU7VKK3_9FIRM
MYNKILVNAPMQKVKIDSNNIEVIVKKSNSNKNLTHNIPIGTCNAEYSAEIVTFWVKLLSLNRSWLIISVSTPEQLTIRNITGLKKLSKLPLIIERKVIAPFLSVFSKSTITIRENSGASTMGLKIGRGSDISTGKTAMPNTTHKDANIPISAISLEITALPFIPIPPVKLFLE